MDAGSVVTATTLWKRWKDWMLNKQQRYSTVGFNPPSNLAPLLSPLPDEIQEKAKCSGMDSRYFFPEGEPVPGMSWRQMEKVAKAACNACEVRQACADYHGEVREEIRYGSGIWGGVKWAKGKRY